MKAIAKAAGLADWEFFSGHSGRVGMARRMAQNGAPTHEIERQGRCGGHHLRRMRALDTIQPEGVDVKQKVFGLSESRIARRVKAIAKVAGLADIEY